MSLLLFATASLLAMQANGQPVADADQTGGSEIVVEGRRDRAKAIRDFVDHLTADVGQDGQLMRFDLAICPGVTGLPRHQKVVVSQRMRRVASTAGLPLGKDGCRPNAILIVANDKNEMKDALFKRYPAFFVDSDNKVHRPLPERGGALLWYVTKYLDADGRLAGATVRGRASRVTPVTQPKFARSVLIVESKATAGLTTTQLADYAAMRLFANARPEDLIGSTAPTIMTVLDAPMDSSVPLTLTEWDLGFLKGLYAMPDGLYQNIARGSIRKSLNHHLETTADAARQEEVHPIGR